MKAQPVFLDFLNREASRASYRERQESVDQKIIRTLAVTLPHGFSVNISQVTEYATSKPKLFADLLMLMGSGIIDATSTNGSLDEFITDRQRRYSHAADRYPFYFSDTKVLEKIKLGSRNDFSMTDDLSRLITGYSSNQFDFDLARASPGDRSHFESGHHATIRKIFDREELAITRDLLESNRGGVKLSQQQIDATTRVISALYMKNYAERRGLATCTGIPDFPYREVQSCFPIYDFPLLARAVVSLGGSQFVYSASSDEVIAEYGSAAHKHFAYHLEAYLESVAEVVRAQMNSSGSLPSMRALFEQFFVRDLDIPGRFDGKSLTDFYSRSEIRLLSVGEKMASRDKIFAHTWSKYVGQHNQDRLAITTATEREDEALFSALGQRGFTFVRDIRTGQGIATEYSLGVKSRILHLRTSAGSIGVNSAGLVIPLALENLNIKFLVSAGICFGLKSMKDGAEFQRLGDVLVSTAIQDYETSRVGKKETKARGEILPAGTGLLQAARLANSRRVNKDFSVYEGVILSGQKLVDREELVRDLQQAFPDAIGGEMEGNAVSAAAIHNGRQFIVVKGICDWGMGKDDKYQVLAANNAISLALDLSRIILDAE